MVSEMEYIHLRHNHKVVKESTKAFQKTHAPSARLANLFSYLSCFKNFVAQIFGAEVGNTTHFKERGCRVNSL